ALPLGPHLSHCPCCGLVLDRVVNAASNSLTLGHHCLASAEKLPDVSGGVGTTCFGADRRPSARYCIAVHPYTVSPPHLSLHAARSGRFNRLSAYSGVGRSPAEEAGRSWLQQLMAQHAHSPPFLGHQRVASIPIAGQLCIFWPLCKNFLLHFM